MKKIGIIGGTFDPIHNGHIYIAQNAMSKLKLDEVVFMVAGNPPHKAQKKITDASLRAKMVRASIKDLKGLSVSEYEISKESYSYTYETLENFKSKDYIIYFITGADCLIDLETWKEVPRILASCIFVVFKRPGYSKEQIINKLEYIQKKYNAHLEYLDIEELQDSSTMIRELIKEHQNYNLIQNLVPSEALEIIKKENLYRS